MFKYILNRLKERSTWLGLIAFATSCGATIATELTESIISVGAALAGLVGVVAKDKIQNRQSAIWREFSDYANAYGHLSVHEKSPSLRAGMISERPLPGNQSGRGMTSSS